MSMEKMPQEEGGSETPNAKGGGVDLSRRGALEKLFGLALMASPFTHSAKEFVAETVFSEATEKELHSYLEKLKEEYGVAIDFSTDTGSKMEISARELSLAEKKDLVKNVYLALSMYPREYIEKIGLKKIRGVKLIEIADMEWFQKLLGGPGGYVDSEQKGMLHLNKESAPFGVHGLLGWTSNDNVRYATHHELFHVADLHLLEQEPGFLDRWAEHGSRSGVERSDPVSYSMVRKTGYATKYGSSAPEEDRAEIAAMLFTKYPTLRRIARKELTLGHKIDKIKRELYEQSGGLIDGTYWELLERGDVGAIQEYFTVERRIKKTG